jgi:hypothetical protein
LAKYAHGGGDLRRRHDQLAEVLTSDGRPAWSNNNWQSHTSERKTVRRGAPPWPSCSTRWSAGNHRRNGAIAV